MADTVTIGGVTRGILRGSLDITKMLGRSGEGLPCSFTVSDETGALVIQEGTPVTVNSTEAGLIFGGFVTEAIEEEGIGNQNYKSITITCRDMAWLAQKRRHTHTYKNTTCEIVLKALCDFGELHEEGVTYTAASIPDDHVYCYADGHASQVLCYANGNASQKVAHSDNLPEARFTRHRVSEILDDFADRLNYYWYFSPLKVLTFRPRTADPAPWALTKNDVYHNEETARATVRRSAEKYRNVHRVRNSNGLMNATQSFNGDGQNQTFSTAMNLHEKPILTVNGSLIDPSLIGINGLEGGKSWYWNEGQSTITQDLTQPPLRAGELLRVDYVGIYPQEVVAQDAAEIAARAALEGNSGIVEEVDDIAREMTESAAQAYASQELTTNKARTVILDFTTDRAGLAEGQALTVDNTVYGLNTTMLIVSVGISGLGLCGASHKYLYRVQAVTGPLALAWAQILGGI